MSNSKVLIVLLVSVVFIAGVGIAIALFYGNGWDFSFDLFGTRADIDESAPLSLDGIDEVAVDCSSGMIVIEAADTPSASLKGSISAREKKESYLEVSTEGGRLMVRFDTDTVFSPFQASGVTLTVRLPEELMRDINIMSSSGNVYVGGIEMNDLSVGSASGNVTVTECAGGSVDISNASGNIRLEDAGFLNISVVCQSGEIRVEGTAAALVLRATSGNIIVADASGPVDANAESGNIELDISGLLYSPVYAGITSGNVTLLLEGSSAFDLNASTTSGNINTDFDILVSGDVSKPVSGDKLSGKCNGGGEDVSLSTVSGNISVLKK